MKIGYVMMALITLLVIVGCKAPVEEVPETPAAPVVEEVVEEAPVEPTVAADAPSAASEGLSYESVDERAQRLIDACKAGNAGLCAALKTQYGIEVGPEGELTAEEEPAEE